MSTSFTTFVWATWPEIRIKHAWFYLPLQTQDQWSQKTPEEVSPSIPAWTSSSLIISCYNFLDLQYQVRSPVRIMYNSLLQKKDENLSEASKLFSCGNLQRVKEKIEIVFYRHCLTYSLLRYWPSLNTIEKKLKRSLLGSGSRTAVKINDD